MVLAAQVRVFREGSASIPGVEIFRSGLHRGKKYTEGDIQDMTNNFNRYSVGDAKPGVKVPAVLGHEEGQEWLDRSDLPAAAWAKKIGHERQTCPICRGEGTVTKDGHAAVCPDCDGKGTVLVTKADFGDVPAKVKKLLDGKAYRTVSAEVYDDIPDGLPDAGKKSKMLRRVAFLGGEIPQIKSLDDIPAAEEMTETAAVYERVELKCSDGVRSDARGTYTVFYDCGGGRAKKFCSTGTNKGKPGPCPQGGGAGAPAVPLKNLASAVAATQKPKEAPKEKVLGGKRAQDTDLDLGSKAEKALAAAKPGVQEAVKVLGKPKVKAIAAVTSKVMEAAKAKAAAVIDTHIKDPAGRAKALEAIIGTGDWWTAGTVLSSAAGSLASPVTLAYGASYVATYFTMKIMKALRGESEDHAEAFAEFSHDELHAVLTATKDFLWTTRRAMRTTKPLPSDAEIKKTVLGLLGKGESDKHAEDNGTHAKRKEFFNKLNGAAAVLGQKTNAKPTNFSEEPLVTFFDDRPERFCAETRKPGVCKGTKRGTRAGGADSGPVAKAPAQRAPAKPRAARKTVAEIAHRGGNELPLTPGERKRGIEAGLKSVGTGKVYPDAKKPKAAKKGGDLTEMGKIKAGITAAGNKAVPAHQRAGTEPKGDVIEWARTAKAAGPTPKPKAKAKSTSTRRLKAGGVAGKKRIAEARKANAIEGPRVVKTEGKQPVDRQLGSVQVTKKKPKYDPFLGWHKEFFAEFFAEGDPNMDRAELIGKLLETGYSEEELESASDELLAAMLRHETEEGEVEETGEEPGDEIPVEEGEEPVVEEKGDLINEEGEPEESEEDEGPHIEEMDDEAIDAMPEEEMREMVRRHRDRSKFAENEDGPAASKETKTDDPPPNKMPADMSPPKYSERGQKGKTTMKYSELRAQIAADLLAEVRKEITSGKKELLNEVKSGKQEFHSFKEKTVRAEKLKAVTSFCEQMKDEGKLEPAQLRRGPHGEPSVIDKMMTLNHSQNVFKFSDAKGVEHSRTQLEQEMAEIRARTPFKFGEKLRPGNPNTIAIDSGRKTQVAQLCQKFSESFAKHGTTAEEFTALMTNPKISEKDKEAIVADLERAAAVA